MKQKSSDVVINPVHKMADQHLISRVQQYLDEHSDAKAVRISDIASELQKTYSEYRRKKQNAFRTAVHNAYTVIQGSAKRKLDSTTDSASVLEARHLEKRRRVEGREAKSSLREEGSSENSFSSDNEEYVNYKNTNAMNSFIQNMYLKSPPVDKGSIKPDTSATVTHMTPNNTAESLFAIDRKGRTSGMKVSEAKVFPDSHSGLRKSNSGAETEKDCVIIDDGPEGPVSTVKSASGPGPSQSSTGLNSTLASELERQDYLNTDDKTRKTSILKTDRVKKLRKNRNESEKKNVIMIEKSTWTFSDIGGLDEILRKICRLVRPLKRPKLYQALNLKAPKCFLLHGPPGCGKTLLAHAIAGQFDLAFLKLSATKIVSGISGESEENIRDVFSEAVANGPCVLFLDEIDAICSKRETSSRDMEKRIVSQLLTCMDDLNRNVNAQVLLIGATSRLDSLDPALRSAGKFDKEIGLGIPGQQARESILKVLCRNLRLAEDFNYNHLAHITPGFVGGDLHALTVQAGLLAAERFEDEKCFVKSSVTAVVEEKEEAEMKDEINLVESTSVDDQQNQSEEQTNKLDVSVRSESRTASSSAPLLEDMPLDEVIRRVNEPLDLSEVEMQSFCITLTDFQVALKEVQPSAKREGFATVPDVTWNDIGALKGIRKQLQLTILGPVKHAEFCAEIGMTTSSGVLLVGPPGCGKTLLAKAVANESGINFISVKGSELLNMYVGESERAVRQVFQRARNSAPCVIFFDELDGLCPKRSDHGENNAADRVVNALLTELDGVEERKQIFVMGATNRLERIDPAVLRPGRLAKTFYLGFPTAEEREDILNTITKSGTIPRFAADVSVSELANDSRCEGLTGADLAQLVQDACKIRLAEFVDSSGDSPHDFKIFHKRHFDAALSMLEPSVTAQDRIKFEKTSRSHCHSST